MTTIEIPDLLWRIEIRTEWDPKDFREVECYYGYLYFGDVAVLERRYNATENEEVFRWAEARGVREEGIREKFTEACAYKIQQMFHSWGGPIR
jgi:hypothetical protein